MDCDAAMQFRCRLPVSTHSTGLGHSPQYHCPHSEASCKFGRPQATRTSDQQPSNSSMLLPFLLGAIIH